jgi:hypothetical protein
MDRSYSLNRKGFLTALGAAGLGLGMTAASGGSRVALAQEESTPATEEPEVGPFEEHLELRKELYADFTAALAAELGAASGDEVDGAIRVALMTVVDQRVADGELTAGKAEAIKLLIATSDVPIGPGFLGGMPHGGFMIGMRRGGHGPFGGHMGPGFGEDHAIFIRKGEAPGLEGAEPSEAEDEEEGSS